MELVYLWVEKYKNIENQGFNFSPRFKCEFKDGELNITDKEKTKEPYLKNFFGKNINITAIVGENGSGKTTLFKIFFEILYMNPKESEIKYFYIINANGKKLTYFSNKIEINKTSNCNKISTNILSNFNTYYMNISHLENIFNKIEHKKEKITYLGIQSDFNIDIFKFNQAYNTARLLEDNNFNHFIIKELNIKQPFFLVFDYFIETEAQKMMSSNQFSALINDSFLYLCYLKLNTPDGDIDTEDKLLEVLDIENKDANKFITTIKATTKKLYPKEYEMIKEIVKFSDKNYTDNNSSLLFSIENYQHCLDNIYNVFDFFIPYFEFSFATKNKENVNLSSGEITILFYLNNVINNILTNKSNILLIDEIELYLHPNWQKKVLNIIRKIFIMNQLEIQIIISSHSPFILSDLPKENVIFLKEGKQVDQFKDKQTFGANIHTLLSDGFFMDNGLMGEFAKDKINEILKLLNSKRKLSKKNQKYCKNVISIIGEPVLKTTLKNMLEEKVYEKESKLDKLKRKKRELDAEIKELENKSNEKN